MGEIGVFCDFCGRSMEGIGAKIGSIFHGKRGFFCPNCERMVCMDCVENFPQKGFLGKKVYCMNCKSVLIPVKSIAHARSLLAKKDKTVGPTVPHITVQQVVPQQIIPMQIPQQQTITPSSNQPPAQRPEQKGDVIFCTNCGASLPSNVKFCKYCGTEL